MGNFNYSVIEIKHRLNVNNPINHETILLDKVISTGIALKCNIGGTVHWADFQIIYRDDNGKVQCTEYNLKDYRFRILKVGDSPVEL